MKFGKSLRRLALSSAGCSIFFNLAGCACSEICPTETNSEKLLLVQLADPQLGFSDYEAELRRFQANVKIINSMEPQPDAVIICGDFVNIPNEQSWIDITREVALIQAPVLPVQGNHDGHYAKHYGDPCYVRDVGQYRFIVVNTCFWKDRAKQAPEMDQWLENALKEGAESGQKLILAGHHPLFVNDPAEAEEYFNIAPEVRQRVIDWMKQYQVIAYLYGHTHQESFHYFDGIFYSNSPTTSLWFGEPGFGYRILQFNGNNLTVRDRLIPANPVEEDK